MLVGAADVGGDNLKYDAVVDLLSGWIFELVVVDGLNFNVVGSEKDDSAIGWHDDSFLL
jgi:hypothetical protein